MDTAHAPDNPLRRGSNLWLWLAVHHCESPIEEAFLRALVEQARARSLTIEVVQPLRNLRAYPTPAYDNGRLLYVLPQFSAGPYRFDFALVLRNREIETSPLIVECDGHDYHERTKEQAIRDRRRDRDAQEAGGTVFRFTGRDIHSRADICAHDTLECLDGLLGRAGEVVF